MERLLSAFSSNCLIVLTRALLISAVCLLVAVLPARVRFSLASIHLFVYTDYILIPNAHALRKLCLHILHISQFFNTGAEDIISKEVSCTKLKTADISLKSISIQYVVGLQSHVSRAPITNVILLSVSNSTADASFSTRATCVVVI